MHCPYCNDDNTKVIDSRLANDGYMVRRRRECVKCTERFTTFETAELLMPRIIKNDGSREPFNEEKLRSGILRALEKRPVDIELIESAINRITRLVRSTADRDVPSTNLGEWVMNELSELDQVAYVRFASVYRSFQDVNEFKEEVDKLEKNRSIDYKKYQLPLLPDDEQ